MKYMLYCILAAESRGPAVHPLGVEARPVQIITQNGLSGACSGHEDPPSAGDRSNLLDYKEVVESFHQHCTVIPMRYGAVFNDPHGINRVLAEQGERFKMLLERLDGCVELGVRILLSRPDTPVERLDSENALCDSRDPGKAYLHRRRAFYSEEARADQNMKGLAEACRGWFQGLFTAFRQEFARPGICGALPFPRPGGCRAVQEDAPGGLVSLNFLIPRRDVERFERRFHKISGERPERLLMSGPWPPYNFVV